MPRFSDIVGQDLIIKELKNNIKSGMLSHAYLFSGEEGVGKKLTALCFGQALNCENRTEEDSCQNCPSCRRAEKGRHEAIFCLKPEGNSFKIEQIRELQREISFSAAFPFHRVIIIEDVHLLTKEAGNALLKILEEPPQNVVFILLTTNLSVILPTIVSRCRQLKFKRIDPELIAQKLQKEVSLEKVDSLFLAYLSQGSFGKATEMAQKIEEIFSLRDEAENLLINFWEKPLIDSFFKISELEQAGDLEMILNLMELFCRDILIYRTGKISILANREQLFRLRNIKTSSAKIALTLREIQDIRMLLNYNVNRRLLLETFFFKVNDLKGVKNSGGRRN